MVYKSSEQSAPKIIESDNGAIEISYWDYGDKFVRVSIEEQKEIIQWLRANKPKIFRSATESNRMSRLLCSIGLHSWENVGGGFNFTMSVGHTDYECTRCHCRGKGNFYGRGVS